MRASFANKAFPFIFLAAACQLLSPSNAQNISGQQSACALQDAPHRLNRKCGVIAPMPEMISFDRVAPLLDAIFEDVASIQIKALNLSATDPNATSLDALQESMQVAASYNSLDGLLNSKNADLLKSNAILQQSILAQYTTGLAQYQSSFDQVNAARTALNTTDQNSPDQPGKDKWKAANDSYQQALQQQATLKAQLDALKTQNTPFSIPGFISSSPAAGSSATGGSTTLKSSLLPQGFSPAPTSITSGTGSGTAGGPSLPPTKQMDTQIGLLWDRMMRMLSTLGQPDSRRDSRFVLLRFYPSVLYADKKTQGIQMTYGISCRVGEPPVILDVYPRISPVNILAEKMRSHTWNLSAVMGFPGSNATANYNREHLRLTNSLGQSSFLTGFGAGTNIFGWTVGKTFGEDTIAPGQRETYALAAVPKNCGGFSSDSKSPPLDGFQVSLVSLKWLSDGKALESTKGTDSREFKGSDPRESNDNREVGELNYSQTFADKAPLTFTLRDSVDPEARILVNSLVLKRSRDAFGRATPALTPKGQALFEDTPENLASGSWSRISERQVTLLLDPSSYKDRLPLITMETPHSSISLSQEAYRITLNGVNTYWPKATQVLPGLWRPDATSLKTGKALRWQQDEAVTPKDHILISLDMDVPTSSSTVAGTTQTVTGSEVHAWGAAPIVVARGVDENDQHEIYSLQVILDGCEAKGLMLDCQAWEPYNKSFHYRETPYIFTVYDTSHNSTNTVVAQVYLHKSDPKKDRKPLFVSIPRPTFDKDRGKWSFVYPVIWSDSPNRNLQVNLTKEADGTAAIPNPTVTCGGDSGCSMKFEVTPAQIYSLSDSMEFSFTLDGKPLSSTEIAGLRSSLEPILDAAPIGQQMELNGRNFVYKNPKLAFGLRGRHTVPLDCPMDEQCIMKGSYPKLDVPVDVYLLDGDREDQPGDAAWHLLTIGAERKAWVYTPPAPVTKSGAVAHKGKTDENAKGGTPPDQKQTDKPKSGLMNSPTIKQ